MLVGCLNAMSFSAGRKYALRIKRHRTSLSFIYAFNIDLKYYGKSY